MKIKKDTLLLIVSSGCLLVSSWFYFTSPQEIENKQIEVVLSLNNRKWQVERLKSGIEQAAKELHTDILYRELAKNEEKMPVTFSDKSDGMIIFGKDLDKKKGEKTLPVINLAKLSFNKEKINNTEFQRGEILGKYLRDRFSTKNPIVYWKDTTNPDPKNREKGFKEGLDELKFRGVSGGVEKVIQEIHQYHEEDSILLIADSPQQLIQLLENPFLTPYKNLKYYVLEFSDKVLASIDEGKVQGAVIQDDYSLGYQGIYQLVGPKNLKNRLIPTDKVVTKENLFSKELEPLAFPHHE